MIPACSAGESVATARNMRAFLRTILAAVVIAAGHPQPAHASPLTVEQIVGLARAGVTDAIILALIDRDRTIFAIEPDQIVALQRDGVSEPVILAMLKSGRAEGDDAARADAADTAAFIRSTLAPAPELVIVGHGPERPNTAHSDGFYSAPSMGTFYGLPYAASYGVPHSAGAGGGRRRGRVPPPFVPGPMVGVTPLLPSYTSPHRAPFIAPLVPPVSQPAVEKRLLCHAQVSTHASARSTGYVTECPAVMQPARRR
jgi:hypothetical protein